MRYTNPRLLYFTLREGREKVRKWLWERFALLASGGCLPFRVTGSGYVNWGPIVLRAALLIRPRAFKIRTADWRRTGSFSSEHLKSELVAWNVACVRWLWNIVPLGLDASTDTLARYRYMTRGNASGKLYMPEASFLGHHFDKAMGQPLCTYTRYFWPT